MISGCFSNSIIIIIITIIIIIIIIILYRSMINWWAPQISSLV